MKTLSICLPDEIAERLQKLAKATGKTTAHYVAEVICEDLEDLEDAYVAETRWRDLQEGRSSTVALEEIIDKFKLEDKN